MSRQLCERLLFTSITPNNMFVHEMELYGGLKYRSAVCESIKLFMRDAFVHLYLLYLPSDPRLRTCFLSITREGAQVQ